MELPPCYIEFSMGPCIQEATKTAKLNFILKSFFKINWGSAFMIPCHDITPYFLKLISDHKESETQHR